MSTFIIVEKDNTSKKPIKVKKKTGPVIITDYNMVYSANSLPAEAAVDSYTLVCAEAPAQVVEVTDLADVPADTPDGAIIILGGNN